MFTELYVSSKGDGETLVRVEVEQVKYAVKACVPERVSWTTPRGRLWVSTVRQVNQAWPIVKGVTCVGVGYEGRLDNARWGPWNGSVGFLADSFGLGCW